MLSLIPTGTMSAVTLGAQIIVYQIYICLCQVGDNLPSIENSRYLRVKQA